MVGIVSIPNPIGPTERRYENVTRITGQSLTLRDRGNAERFGSADGRV
jgi:hypothetical protein